MPRTVIAGGRVLSMDDAGSVFDPGAVVFEGATLTYVGMLADVALGSSDHVVGASDHLVIPGLVNAHTHAVMTLGRGLGDDLPRGEWMPRFADFADGLSLPALRASTLIGCAEMLLGGTTTIADRYIDDIAAKPFVASGIRCVIVNTVADEASDAGKAKSLDLLDRWGTDPETIVHAGLGPHGTDTCSVDLLEWVAETAEARDALVFMHLAQSQQEVAAARQRGFRGPVDLLASVGLLSQRLVAAHCLQLDPNETEMLIARGAAIAFCPSSNAKIEGAAGPLRAWMTANARVALGTDCAPCNSGMDLLLELRIAALTQKIVNDDPAFGRAEELFRLATIGGARALGLGDVVGSLEVGKRADVVLVALQRPGLLSAAPGPGLLVYGASGSDVSDVWVNGVRKVRDGSLADLDLGPAIAIARQSLATLRHRSQRFAGPTSLLPAI